jgi:hypothetical protein
MVLCSCVNLVITGALKQRDSVKIFRPKNKKRTKIKLNIANYALGHGDRTESHAEHNYTSSSAACSYTDARNRTQQEML